MIKKNRINDIISIRAFADMMECAEGTVRKAIREDRISQNCISRDGNGKVKGIDWKKAKLEWARNYSIGKNPSSPVAEALEAEVITVERIDARGDKEEYLSVVESKKRQEHYKAEKSRIELEEKEGSLVRKEQVRKDLHVFGAEVRLAMEGVADRVADDVSNEADRTKCQKIVLNGIREALRKLTEVVERDFG